MRENCSTNKLSDKKYGKQSYLQGGFRNKNHKILMNKYHQGGEDLYTENCQTLMKQKTKVNGTISHVQELEEFVLLKCP